MMLGCKGLRPLNLNTLFLVSMKKSMDGILSPLGA